MVYTAYSVYETPESATLFRVFVAFTVIPVVSVIVRFWSRTVVKHQKYSLDDWTCLTALVLALGLSAIGFWWLRHGLGQHTNLLTPEDEVGGLKALWAGYFVFNLSLGFTKTSALCLYSRIFLNQSRWLRRAIILGHVVLVLWYLCIIFETIFQCMPVDKAWNPLKPGHCIASLTLDLNTLIWDVALDLYILLLPMPHLFRLQARLRLKILASLAFALGYSCIAASISRLVAALQVGQKLNEDFTFNSIPVLVWVTTEAGVGIISICIPSWWQLYSHGRKNGLGALFTRNTVATPIAPDELPQNEHKPPAAVRAAAAAGLPAALAGFAALMPWSTHRTGTGEQSGSNRSGAADQLSVEPDQLLHSEEESAVSYLRTAASQATIGQNGQQETRATI